MVLMLSLVSRISVYEDSTSDFLIDVLRFAIVLLHELDLGSVDRREGCVRRGRGRGGGERVGGGRPQKMGLEEGLHYGLHNAGLGHPCPRVNLTEQ